MTNCETGPGKITITELEIEGLPPVEVYSGRGNRRVYLRDEEEASGLVAVHWPTGKLYRTERGILPDGSSDPESFTGRILDEEQLALLQETIENLEL